MDSMGATRKLMPIPSYKFPIEGIKECFIDTKIFLCISYTAIYYPYPSTEEEPIKKRLKPIWTLGNFWNWMKKDKKIRK